MKKSIIVLIICLVGQAVHSQCNTALIISQGHPAFASSQENATYPPGNAFDGDRTTRWSSLFSDAQYLYIDLGSVVSLCQVNLIWEAAYGKDFTIDISDDALIWTTAATITGNTSLTNNIPITGNGRYVRMNGTARGTPNGYSLYGMHVYGTAPSPGCSITNLALGATGTASSTESIAFPASSAFDGDLGTRWGSAFSDPQSIYCDLGDTYDLCSITLNWESAYATDFTIDVSQDAATWATLVTVTGNTSTVNTIPVSGLARYVRMSGTARALAYGYSLLEFTVHGNIDIVLPITLTGFKAILRENNTVHLQWTTAQETNNDHFEIERSLDGVHYSDIGTLKGKGNSSRPTIYDWTDLSPVKGNNYYRLRQVDIDGKFSYSSVVSVDLSVLSGAGISFYPNPVTDLLKISSNNGELILGITILKITGQQVLTYKIAGSRSINIPMKNMPSGVYIVRVATDHKVYSSKVLKREE